MFVFSFLKKICLLVQSLSDSGYCSFLIFSNNTMQVSVNVNNILVDNG